MVYKTIGSISKKMDFTLISQLKILVKKAMQILLYGSDMELETYDSNLGIRSLSKDRFQGIVNFINSQLEKICLLQFRNGQIIL